MERLITFLADPIERRLGVAGFKTCAGSAFLATWASKALPFASPLQWGVPIALVALGVVLVVRNRHMLGTVRGTAILFGSTYGLAMGTFTQHLTIHGRALDEAVPVGIAAGSIAIWMIAVVFSFCVAGWMTIGMVRRKLRLAT